MCFKIYDKVDSIMDELEKEIGLLIYDYEHPKRVSISKRYPFLKKIIIFTRYTMRNISNILDYKIKIKIKRSNIFLSNVVARHQSVLRRKLGNSDSRLQEQKIVNLQQAVNRLNGVILEPNDIFSLWSIIGKPTYRNGYVDGMILANGVLVEGVGGGLCQLSNFLYWIFLHTPIETLERYHHSMDVFPDSGRVLPFGSGATILYNFVDLKVKNVSKQPLQLKIWITDKYLKGQILSTNSIDQKIHIVEKNHIFIKRGEQYFRYNEIYREISIKGEIKKVEKITTNFAPVLYEVTDEYLKKNNFKVLDFTFV